MSTSFGWEGKGRIPLRMNAGCALQVKLWDPLRTRAIPERRRGVFTTRRCTNTGLPSPLPLPYLRYEITMTVTYWLQLCTLVVDWLINNGDKSMHATEHPVTWHSTSLHQRVRACVHAPMTQPILIYCFIEKCKQNCHCTLPALLPDCQTQYIQATL